ncbi:hypothetical protein IFR05_003715 [Cadophora sp. M221]|nr:hypothetical protein IFR05_003715 [Cadophora sp. M221]
MAPTPELSSDLAESVQRQEPKSTTFKTLAINNQVFPSTSGDVVPKDAVTRVRRGGRKSRGGCIVCKIRRVKCDEVKPSCNRCTSSGRKCEGYASPVPTAPTKINRALVKILPLCDTLPNPSAEIQGTYTQRRSFHYFRTRHMVDTPGNFEPAFWETLVLTYSHSYPTIKQSLVALSRMYEEYENNHASSADSPFQFSALAVHQYNRAVRELVDYIASNQQDFTVALVSCLMFVWIELLQGNFYAAFRHLDGGLKILNDFASSKWYTSWSVARKMETIHDVNEIHGSLARSFMRLRIQAAACGHRPPTFIPRCSSRVQAFSSIPPSFANIFESRNYLDIVFNSVFDFFRQIRDIDHGNESEMRAMRESKVFHLKRLEDWEAANRRMAMESVPAHGHPYTSGVLYLDLYYTVISVILKTMCASSEMIFDEYLKDFEHIVSLSQTLIQNTLAGAPMLSLDMCVIPPLCMVVCKCRFLPLRRKALKLLESTPDQEGMWDRAKILKLSAQKINIEEEGRGDVPETDPLPEAARIWKKRILYRNKGKDDEEVLRYFYFGKGPVEVEFYEKADLAERIVNFKIMGGAKGDLGENGMMFNVL